MDKRPTQSRLPTFTADVALYEDNKNYRVVKMASNHGSSIYPQQLLGCNPVCLNKCKTNCELLSNILPSTFPETINCNRVCYDVCCEGRIF